MITIRDLIISPFEIDVDRYNFTLVKRVRGEKGETRKTQGYFHTLEGALGAILRCKQAVHDAALEGQVVSLKEFIAGQQRTKELMIKCMKYIGAPATILEEDGIPIISPKQFMANSNVNNVDNNSEIEEDTNTTEEHPITSGKAGIKRKKK